MSTSHKRCIRNELVDAAGTVTGDTKCKLERDDECCPDGHSLSADANGEKICTKKWRAVGYQKLSDWVIRYT